MTFKHNFSTKWSDFDPNRHMRHTAYADYAAEVRTRFFIEHHLTLDDFARMHIGPVLFREESVYLKEIHIGEDITVTMELKAASKNFERWQFYHQIFNQEGKLSATVVAEGAWFDLQKRKLTTLPDEILSIVKAIPKSDSFVEIELK